MPNLTNPGSATSLPRVSSFAMVSSVASIASLAWPLLSPVSSATARANSVLLMLATWAPPQDGVCATVCAPQDGKPFTRERSSRLKDRRSRSSSARHGRQDDQHVAVADLRIEALEHPHVLVVEVDVDVAVEVAAVSEDLGLRRRMVLRQRAEDLPDGGAAGRDLLLAAGGRAQDRRDLHGRHTKRRSLARGGAERFVVREDAHLLVGDLVGLPGAHRALRIAADLELGERRAERLVEQQSADERLARADD